MKFHEILTKSECDTSKNCNFALSPLFSMKFYKKPPFSMTASQTETQV